MYQFWLVLCQLTVWTSPAETLLGLTLTLSTVGGASVVNDQIAEFGLPAVLLPARTIQ